MKLKELLLTNPVYQGIIILILIIITCLFLKIKNSNSILVMSWLCLFVFANPVIGIFNKKWARYTLLSISTYIIITVAIYILTHFYITNPAQINPPEHLFVMVSLSAFYFMLIALSFIYRSIINGLMNE
jgi:RsiW-degrading membrane proteinase PrsW (M82 family)